MSKIRYFDNAATTKICKEALDTYIKVSEEYFANPSSKHSYGLKAKAYLEEMRRRFSNQVGCDNKNLFFTSGASESISIVLSSLLWAKRPSRVIFSSIEHDAVLSFIPILKEKGFDVVLLKAPNGYVKAEDLEKAINNDTKLVAIQYVNNLLGSVQNIKELVNVVRKKEKEINKKIFFFTDAVQALCKIKINLKELDVDGASFSSHKIHGPRGVGALYLKNNMLQVLAKAGGQESGIRGGTENLPAIAAFTVALENYKDSSLMIKNINQRVREVLDDKRIKILSSEDNNSNYILSISTPLPSEVLTRMLSDLGYAVSSGSACSNNAKGKSEGAILAMGYSNNIARGMIRISFSYDSSMEDAIELANLILERVREF